MGKIIDLKRNQRKKLHLMSLDSGEKVLTSWIDNNTAQNILKRDDAVIYRLPSGQLFADIALTDKHLSGDKIVAKTQNQLPVSGGQNIKTAESKPFTKARIRKNNIDITDLI